MNEWHKIYLHWSATGHQWTETGDYHTIVTGDGAIHHMTPYTDPLYASTYGRNTGSISLAVACMSPEGGTWAAAPTEAQLDSLCKEAAHLALGKGWAPDDLQHRIMTHAEAAANRDYPRDLVARFSFPDISAPSSSWDRSAQAAGLPHANYGPSSWSDGWPTGDVVRWDLWQLRESDVGGAGGHELRLRIRGWMGKLKIAKAFAP